MSVFTQKFNRITGKSEWTMQPENYDYHQEVARSSYADMLHDSERNHKYFLAIKKAVESMKKVGRTPKVLDIGTGTGLLSMMSVQSGAEFVTACEAFNPVAECAVKVIKDNGFDGKIKVIPKRSTELSVGQDGDMKEKANILVTEVFDTELIGEGALGTFHHALSHLLEEDCIVVPSLATVYAQVVESPLISRWNRLHELHINESTSIMPPLDVQSCPGAAAVHDLQLENIDPEKISFLTDVVPVFRFDFAGRTPLKMESVSTTELTALKSGKCEAVLMWWDLHMDMEGTITLSCAPPWTHPNPSEIQWRDHWMQAIYYLPESLEVCKGDNFTLRSFHDEYSLWFSADKINNTRKIPRPICSCLVHASNSRTRIGMLNDPVRNKNYLKILEKIITPASVVLSISNGSLLPLVAAKLGAKRVFAVENSLNKRIMESFSDFNKCSDQVKFVEKPAESLTSEDVDNEVVDVLLSEPYFSSSLLPWDLLYFWYLRSSLTPLLSSSVKVVPQKATILAMAVDFRDLWKIRAPVGNAEGFNLSAFDKMVQEAISVADEEVEPHPLWEYPCKPLISPFELLSFDLSVGVGTQNVEILGRKDFESEGICNGVALWMDFRTDGVTNTMGPIKPVVFQNDVEWDRYSRQGVYFIHPPSAVSAENMLEYSIIFNPNTGNVNFSFAVKS